MGKTYKPSRCGKWASGFFYPEGKLAKRVINKQIRRTKRLITSSKRGYRKGTISHEWF